jgi:hypothetical protein
MVSLGASVERIVARPRSQPIVSAGSAASAISRVISKEHVITSIGNQHVVTRSMGAHGAALAVSDQDGIEAAPTSQDVVPAPMGGFLA